MIKKLLITLFLIAYLVSPAFASGIILGWDDTIANIPTNWNLTDGNGGRPNLLDKYLKCVGSAEDPGATGGATTHTHTSPAHTHTQNAHGHGGVTSSGGSLSGIFYGGSVGETITSGTHTHDVSLNSNTASNQTTVVTLDSASSEPPYSKLAFIYDSGINKYPVGSIILWNSATLPTGWILCDGNNGTDNLGNVFIKSVGSGENPGATGGSSNSHTHTNTAHNHTQNSHSHSGSHTAATPSAKAGTSEGQQANTTNHVHGLTVGDATSTNQTSSVTITNGDGQPAYYKLLYIKNTGSAANRPKNSIVIWTGTIANIPSGYVLCDGNNSTPNLLDKFIKGAVNSGELGNTGGSATHVHSTSAHTHIQNSHTHSVAFTDSSFENIPGYHGSTGASYPHVHNNLTSASATATNQDTTITVDSVNGEPPYYKVAYIMQNRDLDLGGYSFIID